MKKILFTIFITCMFFACDDRLEELNRPTKAPVEVPAETLFSNGLKELAYMVTNSNTNINVFRLYGQYWAQTTYPDESQYNMVTRRNPDNFWRGAYRDALKDLDEARKITVETAEALGLPDEVRDNRIAIIDICKVYGFAALVDAFGPIPFSEALNPEILQPKYDDDEEVYNKLIDMLDAAIGMIDTGAESFPSTQDLLYGGDLKGWVKFANSLKLKMAITISDVNSGKAGNMVAEAVSGVFQANKDNASFTYLGAFPNTNPVHEDLVQSGRDDYVIANTIVDKMNALYDPRLLVYAQGINFTYPLNANKVEKDSTVTSGGNMILYYPESDSIVYATTPFTIYAADTLKPVQFFIGGVYGTNNTFSLKSHIGTAFYQPDLEGLLMDYAEVQFLLAEAAARGFTVPKTAEEYYNAGIRASMEYWGVPTSMIDDYLANPDVAYTTAPGTWKQKIGSQHWLALYNRGFEGWTVWRRLDFTGFNTPPLLTYSDIPERFIYPIEEATLNKANLVNGIQLLGGDDDANTKVFWDVN